MSEGVAAAVAFSFLGLIVFGGIGGCAYVYPQYNVYSQRMAGKPNFSEQKAIGVSVLKKRVRL